MLDVLGSRYEYLVIPELDPALEYRPASVVLTPVESDVIDLRADYPSPSHNA